MAGTKTKRMGRVLKVLQSLRQREEARLRVMERRSHALKSAQSSAIATLNDQYELDRPQAAGFARLLADQLRLCAAQEQAADQQAARQRDRLAMRRGLERVTEQLVSDLSQADQRSDEAAGLEEVIEVYRGKPAASKR